MKNDTGSVLMEYVVVTGFVSVFLLGFLQTQFYNVDEGYVGELGKPWAAAVQRFHRAIALPIP